MENGRRRAGTLVMKTTFSCRLAIVALAAAVLIFGFARPSYAQPRQNPTPAPATPQNPAPAPTPAKHTISVHFDYDFDRTPACPQPKDKLCVQQFVVYDVSSGFAPKKRFQLFTIPLPPDPKGKLKGITGTSQPLSFQSGKHLIAVTAKTPDEKESDLRLCRVVIVIP
jgi:hypothetical protein